MNLIKKIIMNTEKWIIYDVESGEPIEVSKAVYDRYTSLLSEFKSSLKDEKIGEAVFLGTAGDLDNNTDYKDLFTNPDNYNLK